MSLQRSQRRGFTLLELMIVVAVVVLLLVATLPRVKYALDESKVRESSRQLNSYFALAKSRAASTGRPCGVWFVSDVVGDPNAAPAVFLSTQLYLAEVPPPYSGDVLEARVIVVNDPANPGYANPRPLMPQQYNPMTGAELIRWQFPLASVPSLSTLVTAGEPFAIRFDHKGPLFPAYWAGNFVYITGPIIPPQANGLYDPMLNPYAGYSFEIIRSPIRVGAPLALPRGTCVDLTYSGFGNYGTDFYSSPNMVLVLFGPDGHVANASYYIYDPNSPPPPYRPISNDAPGTIHFLVGRPEKVNNPLATSNLFDSKALWVSVGRLTGSVVTTENAPNLNLPLSNPPTAAEVQTFLTVAREFAITQDVAGAR